MDFRSWWHLPLTCPRCHQATVKFSYAEFDDGNATLNYSCDKCGMVKAAVISLRLPPVK
jgi:hypothetical protein